MIEYGYMNGGYLVSKIIEEYSEKYKEAGETKERVVNIAMQKERLLEAGWKPVDTLDKALLLCKEGYIVRITPYDAGDRISYNYETIFDKKKVRQEIQDLKEDLQSEDYKITKCYEASLLGLETPYAMQELYNRRQAQRDKINKLETILKK